MEKAVNLLQCGEATQKMKTCILQLSGYPTWEAEKCGDSVTMMFSLKTVNV